MAIQQVYLALFVPDRGRLPAGCVFTKMPVALLLTSLASKVGYTIVGHPWYCLTKLKGNIAIAGY